MLNLIGGIAVAAGCVLVCVFTLAKGKAWTKFTDDLIEKDKKNK